MIRKQYIVPNNSSDNGKTYNVNTYGEKCKCQHFIKDGLYMHNNKTFYKGWVIYHNYKTKH